MLPYFLTYFNVCLRKGGLTNHLGYYVLQKIFGSGHFYCKTCIFSSPFEAWGFTKDFLKQWDNWLSITYAIQEQKWSCLTKRDSKILLNTWLRRDGKENWLHLVKPKLDLVWYVSLNHSYFGVNINIRSSCDYLVEVIWLDQHKWCWGFCPEKVSIDSQTSNEISGQDWGRK